MNKEKDFPIVEVDTELGMYLLNYCWKCGKKIESDRRSAITDVCAECFEKAEDVFTVAKEHTKFIYNWRKPVPEGYVDLTKKEISSELNYYLISEYMRRKLLDSFLRVSTGKNIMEKEEFKTLNDIPEDEKGLIYKDNLKAEAIKWLKREFNEDWSDNDLNYLDWMDFFNITEEDLK